MASMDPSGDHRTRTLDMDTEKQVEYDSTATTHMATGTPRHHGSPPSMSTEDDEKTATAVTGGGDGDHAPTKDVTPAAIAGDNPSVGPPGGGGLPPVPDGGLQAWTQVACGFMLMFNTWGILNTFGIFQTYYESGRLFREESSNIAWIGSINAFLLLFGGFLSGPIFDKGYLRHLLLIGSFMTIFGYMMLSLCKDFWQVILAQGFCIGIGGSCLFVPAVSILPGYFRRHLGLALGIAASGSSIGGIIYPIVFYRLIDRIGFGWTTRVLGFMALATLLPPLLFMKQRVKPPKARSLIDWTAFHDGPYLLFILSSWFGFIGLYTFLFYLSFFGAATGIASYSMSFYIVPILNAASVFGRTIPNFIADTTGPLNVIVPCTVIMSILIFCLIAVHNLGGLVVIAILNGAFSGIYVSNPPLCIAGLTKDKSKIGTRMGLAFGFLSTSVLVGGPATGAIIGSDPANLHFDHAWIFGAVMTMVGGVGFLVVRVWLSGTKLRMKV